MKTGVIEINVRLYLNVDVDENEARDIIDNMDYGFEHSLIADSDIYNFEQVE